MKRILTIQDISCFGKCSITIALPVISAMGVETTILPTAVLSTHTMFKGFTVKDLTDQLRPITAHWKAEGIHFDAIYTGYLGSAEEIEISREIFRTFREDGTLVFIDPAMADNGKMYPAFDENYARLNAGLCAEADIIVPNITEACFMTGTEYKEVYDEAYILNTETGEHFVYQNGRIDASYHGTGDLFSSVAVGGLVQGLSLTDAFRIAADYTAHTIDVTLQNPERPWYGVDFETTLPDLMKMLGK